MSVIFVCKSLLTNGAEHLSVLIVYLGFSSVECLFRFSAHSFIVLFVFLLTYRFVGLFLCILDTYPFVV